MQHSSPPKMLSFMSAEVCTILEYEKLLASDSTDSQVERRPSFLQRVTTALKKRWACQTPRGDQQIKIRSCQYQLHEHS